MKKTVILTLVGLLALAFAASFVSAAAPPVQPPCAKAQQTTLTDAQKQELIPLLNQMMEI